MITDLLLAVVGLIVDGLVALLPTMDLPGLDYAGPWVTSFASYIRALLNPIVPVDEYVAIISPFVLVWLPAFLIFVVVKFFVAYIPSVGGK